MFNRKKKLSFWARVKTFFFGIYWKFRGEVLHAQLQDKTSPLRTDGELAVERIVYETRIAPDCVVGMIVRGYPAIQVKHDPHGNGATQTIFIQPTYAKAADEAIEWINAQGLELTTKTQTKITNTAQYFFNNKRKKVQGKLQKKRRHGGSH